MGPERLDDDPHGGSCETPKLTLAGRIDGTVDGRPIRILAARRDVIFEAGRLRTFLAARRGWRSTFLPLRALLARMEVRLLVRLGRFGTIELFPRPALLTRLMLPSS